MYDPPVSAIKGYQFSMYAGLPRPPAHQKKTGCVFFTQNGSEPEEPKPPWRAGATSASESEVRRLAMAGATEGGLSAVLLVLIVSFWLPDRYRQDGAEAPSLLIAITPWFARRSPFGVREHSTPADVCKQVEQVRDLSPVRLHLTLRPPISTSVHHLLSGNCDAQLLSQKNSYIAPRMHPFGGIGQSGACFTLTIRDRASAVPPGIPRLAPARFLTSTLSRHAIPRFVLNSSRKRQFFVSNRSAASAM